MTTTNDRVLSHVETNLEDRVNAIKENIDNNSSLYVSNERQYEILDELKKFELGKFMISNQGLNGYWTHYIVNYSVRNKIHPSYLLRQYININKVEKFILEEAPGVIASQERFSKYLKYNNLKVKNGARIASIPSGTLDELLFLNYAGIKNISLLAVDIDNTALNYAEQIANKINFEHNIKYLQSDAWEFKYKNEFDLISNSGLVIYEPDDEKILQLYKNFYEALRVNGVLVTSFITYPIEYKELSEWKMDQVNLHALLMQKIIFSDILQMKWECYRTSNNILQLLKKAGFTNIRIDFDKAQMCPTVIAVK